MIFTSQSGLTDTSRESEWDLWYIDHLRIMASVPGIGSAQRFKTSNRAYSPSLAMYSVASADVFQDPYYLSVRGMGPWLPLIDRQYYHRNLFDGLDRAPEVAGERVLLVADREAPAADLPELDWVWLRCVGLDRSTAYRGIVVLDESAARSLDLAEDIALYVPATGCYKDKDKTIS